MEGKNIKTKIPNNKYLTQGLSNIFVDTDTCTEEGKTQRRDCETCTCMNKQWHCTNTGCPTRLKRGKQRLLALCLDKT